VHVEEKKIRFELRNALGGFGSGAGSIDKLIFGLAQQHLQRCADHRMVVD
jgi:hypothetical protein